VKKLLGLYYIRWNGTPKELKKYIEKIEEIANSIEEANFKGAFTPTSEWNAVLLFEGTSFDNILNIYKQYMKKYGTNPKIPVAKFESLFSFDEIGY